MRFWLGKFLDLTCKKCVARFKENPFVRNEQMKKNPIDRYHEQEAFPLRRKNMTNYILHIWNNTQLEIRSPFLQAISDRQNSRCFRAIILNDKFASINTILYLIKFSSPQSSWPKECHGAD